MNKLAKIETTQLDETLKDSGLAIQEGEEIKQSYIPFIVQLAEIQEQAKKIDFENPKSIDETVAHELRMKTVKIRTGASDLKDERKRIFLLKGNLEQAAYKVIEASCKLTEETLVNIEKAREIAEKKRKEERKMKRIEILTALQFDFTYTNLLDMPDDQFDKLVLKLENERDIRLEVERKAEEERLRKIEEEKIENERIRAENEKLRLEREAKEKELQKEREKAAKEKAEAEEKARKEKAITDAKLKTEREAKEKLEREIEAKRQQELKAKRELEIKAENERKAKELEAKKAAKAPDKVKLTNWIDSIELPIIELKELESKLTGENIQNKFKAFKKWAKEQIDLLQLNI